MTALALALTVLLLILTIRFGQAGLIRLTMMRLRCGWLPILACLAQLVSLFTQQQRLEWLIMTAGLLAGFCWLNRRQPGLSLVAIGIILNLLVMGINGGTMPVNPTALEQMSHKQLPSGSEPLFTKARVLHDDAAVLAWLGDRFLLPGPLAHLAVWSLGDGFLIAGVGRLLWSTMKGQPNAPGTLWRAGTSP
jgi:Family of unknown function (DUF5317)